jgi:hypothetical protein
LVTGSVIEATCVPRAHCGRRGLGQSPDFNKLIENHDLDYVRATLPNVGGITEMVKIVALCETHFGSVPVARISRNSGILEDVG